LLDIVKATKTRRRGAMNKREEQEKQREQQQQQEEQEEQEEARRMAHRMPRQYRKHATRPGPATKRERSK
jgi:hypothetical protein